MVQCKLLKQLDILGDKKFDDEDMVEDIKFLTEFLETSVQDLRYKYSPPSIPNMCIVVMNLNNILFEALHFWYA